MIEDTTATKKPELRETVSFWQAQFDESRRRREIPLARFERYAGYIAGELGDVEAACRRFVGCKREDVVSVNVMSLVARRWLASLMFRQPRPEVRPVRGFSRRFTPECADVETRLLVDWIEDVNFFKTGRKGLLDGLLADVMVFKVGYEGDSGASWQEHELGMKEAQLEDQRYLTQAVRPVVRKGQYHREHIEQHSRTLAEAELGTNPMVQLPEKELEYLRKHVKRHEREIASQRPTDEIRRGRAYCIRVAPNRFQWDPFAESVDQAEWVGECFMRPVDVVRADERYDGRTESGELVRDVVQATEVDDQKKVYGARNQGEIPMVLLYEVIDLRRDRLKVVTWAKDGPAPLRVIDYPMADILPSGPYVVESFIEDPIADVGVPIPTYFESHQRAATILATLNQDIARRSRPVRPYDASGLDPSEVEMLRRADVAGMVPLTKIAGKKIQDVIMDLQPAQVPAQNLLMEDRSMSRAEQLSGFGSAPLGGGERSKTATAAVIVNESNSVSVADAQSIWDNVQTRILRRVLRIIRCFYDRQLIAELVGEDVLEPGKYPDKWTRREILNDKGATVVAGSTRGQDDNVRGSLLAELYAVLRDDPILAAVPTTMIQILQRVFDSFGLYGIDLSGVKRMAEVQAALMLAGGAGGAGAPQGAQGAPGSPQVGQGGPGASQGSGTRRGGSKRPSEAGRSPGTQNGPGARQEAMQHSRGANRGNRMPTGASRGDRVRPERGERPSAMRPR